MTETDTFTAPACGWHCFHCGEHFLGTRDGQLEAELHFGPTPDHKPACIERTTLTFGEIMKRYRKAVRREHRAWERVRRAEEAQEAAEYAKASAEGDLAYATSTDVRNKLDYLRGIEQCHNRMMAALHKHDPALFQTMCVAAFGPGEYFPPSKTA